MQNIQPWKVFSKGKEDRIVGDIEPIKDTSMHEHNLEASLPILNNHYFQQNMNKEIPNFVHSTILVTSWNWQIFSQLFGPRSFQFQGDECVYDIWAVSYQNEVFLLLTCDAKGSEVYIMVNTDDETFYEDTQLGKKCIAFWTLLAQKIEEVHPEAEKLNKLKKVKNTDSLVQRVLKKFKK